MDPLYREVAGLWVPDPNTRGPVEDAQHGGAVAGLLGAGLEWAAAKHGAGVPVLCSVVMLRPAPLSAGARSVEAVRVGGRTACLRAELTYENKRTATATGVFAHPTPVAELPPVPRGSAAPGGEAVQPIADAFPPPRFWTAVEFRAAQAGRHWLRLERPLVAGRAPLATVMALADWAQGVSLWSTGTPSLEKAAGFPTLDLTVHLTRPFEGEWLGMQPTTTWYDNGLGLTETALHDVRGPLGRCAQSFVVIPKSGDAA